MLTERDREILLALSHKVRLLWLPQIVRTWWRSAACGPATAQRRLGALVRDGWLGGHPIVSHVELPLVEPLVRWAPGERTPDPFRLEHAVRSRWSGEVARAPVFFATRRAAAFFGGTGGGLKHPLQADHDIHVAAIYLRLLSTNPGSAEAWVSEDLVAPAGRGEKRPDAVLRDAAGQVRLAVEFAGRYNADRIRDFHKDCEQRALPYELW